MNYYKRLTAQRRIPLLIVCIVTQLPLGAQTPAEKLIEAGHWKRARAIVEPHFREQPGDPLANFLMSQIRNAFGDHDSPLSLAEKAVALDGNVAKFHRQLAEALGVAAQHANMFQQVMLARRFKKEIDRALELDPKNTQAWRDLMEYYALAPGIAGGDKAKAQTVAERIAALDPADGFFAKARLAELSKAPAKMEEMFRSAVEAEPANYRARTALASFLTAPDHASLDAAEQQAKEAVKIDPGRAPGYAILAQIYATRGQWADLDSALSTAEKEVPDDLVPYYRAAEALIASKRDLPRAERYLGTYLAAEPEGNEPTLAEAKALLHSIYARHSTR
jgi:tetratricopeptide (TPR) repeat protein